MTLPLNVSQITILVVEDTAVVLATVRTILEHANFTVLAAANASEAAHLAGCANTIDLLLSDIMMPDIPGPDLALKLKEGRPEMRVILMSGYPEGKLLALNHGWPFIQKPFLPVQFVAKIKEVLGGETRGQLGELIAELNAVDAENHQAQQSPNPGFSVAESYHKAFREFSNFCQSMKRGAVVD